MNVLDFFPHSKYRPQQKDTILEIQKYLNDDSIENIILESPTGSGKSAIAMCLGLYYKSAFLLTSQKILQDQYTKDYSSNRVCVLKGRNNYSCKLYSDFTCEDSYCATKSCPIKPQCYYELAKAATVNAHVALLNYKYFLCIMNYTEVFSQRKLLICDEAHNIDDECMSFVEFNFSSLYLSRLGVTGKIPTYEKIEEYVDWIKSLIVIIEKRKKEAQEKLKNKFLPLEEASIIQKELESLISQQEKIDNFFKSYDKVEWIFDISVNEKLRSKTITFKPLTIGYFANSLLFKHAEKKLFMSATILDAESFCKNLDLDINKTKFISVPSSFSPDIRPMFLTRSGNLGKTEIDNTLPKIVTDIEKILEFHDNERGLIHTHTYRIANYIKENIDPKYSKRILLHDSTSRTQALSQYIASTEPLALLTPSMTEGIDLKDDLARFVVIVKLPFMFLGDKQVKKRMEMDQQWYNWKTALTLVQAAGRGVRHENDFCTIYIMDSQFSYFLKQNKRFFPKYFIDAIKN